MMAAGIEERDTVPLQPHQEQLDEPSPDIENWG